MAPSIPETASVPPTDDMKLGFFDELKAYVGFAESDSAALAAAVPAPGVLDRVVERFYRVLMEHEGTRRVLVGDATVERLKKTLRAWLETLFAGPHDSAYFEKRCRIGRTHVRIGLDQHYMFAAMALIREDLSAALGPGPAAVALHKVLDMELAIMLETYREERFEIEMLRESERTYRDLIENAPEMILTIDRDGRIRHQNRKTLEILGHSEDSAPAHWRDLAFPGAAGPAWERIARAFVDRVGSSVQNPLPPARTQGPPSEGRHDVRAANVVPAPPLAAGTPEPAAEFETTFVDKKGEPRTVLVRVAGLVHPPRGPDAVRLFVEDVTQRKRLEERMTQFAREAEEKKRLAAVGQMVAGIAHEIRTPLQVITAGFDSLAAAARSPDLQTDLARSREGIRQVRKFMQEILDYAKDIQLEPMPVEPESLLSSVLADLAADISGRRLAVQSTVEPGMGRFEADPFRLKQVLVNVVANAAEATPDGGRVSIRASCSKSSANDAVEFAVTDSGRGISPDEMEKLFLPFYTTKPRGTGLGLAIVRRIVDAHGGRIEVQSCPGIGTTVRILLPRRLPPTPDRGTKKWPARRS